MESKSEILYAIRYVHLQVQADLMAMMLYVGWVWACVDMSWLH